MSFFQQVFQDSQPNNSANEKSVAEWHGGAEQISQDIPEQFENGTGLQNNLDDDQTAIAGIKQFPVASADVPEVDSENEILSSESASTGGLVMTNATSSTDSSHQLEFGPADSYQDLSTVPQDESSEQRDIEINSDLATKLTDSDGIHQFSPDSDSIHVSESDDRQTGDIQIGKPSRSDAQSPVFLSVHDQKNETHLIEDFETIASKTKTHLESSNEVDVPLILNQHQDRIQSESSADVEQTLHKQIVAASNEAFDVHNSKQYKEAIEFASELTSLESTKEPPNQSATTEQTAFSSIPSNKDEKSKVHDPEAISQSASRPVNGPPIRRVQPLAPPRVHIRQIDIVIQAPAPAKSQTPASTPGANNVPWYLRTV